MVDPRFAQAQAGDEAALTALFHEHRGLVGYFLRGWFVKDLATEDEDLRAAGDFGLVQAIRTYHEACAFSTWAKYSIHREAIAVVRQQPGFRRGQGYTADFVGWDTIPDGNLFSLAEIIPSPEPRPDEQMVAHDQRTRINRAMAQLRPRDRTIISRQFFDGDAIPKLAAEWGVTPVRVGQMRARGLRQLRGMLQECR